MRPAGIPSYMRRFGLAGGLVGLLASGRPMAQSPQYTFHQIDAGFSPAMDVNDEGTVVGWTTNSSVGFVGYIWSLASGFQPMTDPSVLGRFPRYTAVNDPTATLRINASGTIAGVGCPQGCGFADTKAAMWNSTQGFTALGSFDNGLQNSGAGGINDAGQIVGYSWGGGYNNFGPFIFSSTGGLQHLAGFDGLNGYALGINSHGVVVGAKGTGSRNVAFVWSAVAGQTDISDPPGATTTIGFAINDSGVVVGRYLAADQTTYGVFRWSPTAGTEDLIAPAGFPELLDINNAGAIVATIISATSGDREPYIYQNGTWTNLNDLMPAGTSFTLQFVEAINNHGWIAGLGTTPTESGQGFLLIPPNHGPTAVDTSANTLEDVATSGTLPAIDPDGDTLAYSIVANGSLGTATITNAASGVFTYTPRLNANGTDTFTFRATDAHLDSNVATVTVTITPVNDAPTAANGIASVNAGASVAGGLNATDVDSLDLTYHIVGTASKGTATITDARTGAYRYTANMASSGIDTFTYQVSDGSLTSNVATVSVTIVAPPPDTAAPVVTPPGAITIDATEPTGATGAASLTLAEFLAGGTATDSIDPNPARLAPQVSGVDATNATLFPLGVTMVSFRFRDASGNVGTAASQVTVVSPQRRMAGSGYNFPETVTYRATFSLDVTGPLSPVGSVQYSYTRTRMNLVSASISTFTVTGTTAVIVGAGSVNGVAGYTFTATATDGSRDTFGIVIRRPDGTVLYSAPSVALVGGVLTMTP